MTLLVLGSNFTNFHQFSQFISISLFWLLDIGIGSNVDKSGQILVWHVFARKNITNQIFLCDLCISS